MVCPKRESETCEAATRSVVSMATSGAPRGAAREWMRNGSQCGLALTNWAVAVRVSTGEPPVPVTVKV